MRIEVPRPTTWVALTGFMGVGKTRIGRELAQELMLHFIDLDRYIERETGLSIPDIFRYLGEATFRRLEAEAVAEVASKPYLVVALGGGTFVNPENRRILLARGPVVALWASPETIYERVRRRPGKRPLLAGEAPLERIRKLLAEREAAYREAPIHASTDQRASREVVQEIIEKLWRWREAQGT
ncbi:Shikimate kinase [Marinithermus hydrothermalis DSM 14884]|uniref:Shikimate kinase n=2 Tax=Marinithermus TaxID=186191 RepID=F2NQR5_MARHT|nr:Shikimate kinase [Marinithermus hydrothermalis DSM 14884]